MRKQRNLKPSLTALRAQAADRIEQLIAFLDELDGYSLTELEDDAGSNGEIENEHGDGNPDNEPSLGWTDDEASRGRIYAGRHESGVDLEAGSWRSSPATPHHHDRTRVRHRIDHWPPACCGPNCSAICGYETEDGAATWWQRRVAGAASAVVTKVLMKFTLNYDGPLPSGGNRTKAQAKWAIRKAFDPQLQYLWNIHPALQAVRDNRHFPRHGGAPLVQTHHQYPGAIYPVVQAPLINGVQVIDGGTYGEDEPQEIIDLCAPIEKHGAWFIPLVRETHALHCGLKILFLRYEPPGKLYQGGDLDGRLKTLIDAMTMPQHREQVHDGHGTSQTSPIFCLLEDDLLVSGLAIESERLLAGTSNRADWVKLTIEVDVRVRMTTVYNTSFLG